MVKTPTIPDFTKKEIMIMTTTKKLMSAIEDGSCVCTYPPLGDHGLEGYQENHNYRYQKMRSEEDLNNFWYRVYPCDEFPHEYETCSVTVFRRHFKPVSAQAEPPT